MDKQLDLKDVALIGRTFDEYYRIFNLNRKLLRTETILDAAAGVSSFCAEAMGKGFNVTASDKIYSSSPHKIEQKCRQDLEMVIRQFPEISDMYVWEYFKDITALKENREKAYKLFIKDFKEHGTKRYLPAEYPVTDFKDKQFSFSLVSHLLFLYEDRLDYNFHKRTILELLRITSKEIRVFPVVNMKGKRSKFFDLLRFDRDFADIEMSIQKVDYEFMKNTNEMLVINIV